MYALRTLFELFVPVRYGVSEEKNCAFLDLLVDRLIPVHTHVGANEIATRSHYFCIFYKLADFWFTAGNLGSKSYCSDF